MTTYVESPTKSGTPIRIEVESTTKGVGFGQAASTGEVKNQSGDSYTQVLDTIRACATGIIDTLQGLETPPQTASVNFAIKVEADSGAMIARSGDNAQFKVSLTWKKDEPDDDDD